MINLSADVKKAGFKYDKNTEHKPSFRSESLQRENSEHLNNSAAIEIV